MPWSGPRHTKGNTWCEIHAYKEKNEEVNSTVSHSNHALPAHGGGLPHSAEADSPSPPPAPQVLRHLPQPHRGRAAPPSARPTRTTHDIDLCLAQHLRSSAAPKTTLPGPRSRPVLQGPRRRRPRPSAIPYHPVRLRPRPPAAPGTVDPTEDVEGFVVPRRGPLTTPSSPTPRSRCNPTRHVHG